jgi:thiamine-phosphate pyrophosphorylase
MTALVLQGYYAILDVQGPAAPDLIEMVVMRADELLAARPCCLQLRGKRLSAAALAAAASQIQPRCRAVGIPLCVNDRLDVALAVGAELVHLGQDDLPLGDARRVVLGQASGPLLGRASGGPALLLEGRLGIGVSTHNQAQAQAAVAGGADYIAIGPIFPTRSKERPDPVVGLEGLRAVVRVVAGAVPVVAIGGIELDAVAQLAAAGASAAAVISAVDQAPDRSAAGRRVASAFLPA